MSAACPIYNGVLELSLNLLNHSHPSLPTHMGNTASTTASGEPRREPQVFNEKEEYHPAADVTLEDQLRGLQILPTAAGDTPVNPISIDSLSSWESKLLADPKNKLAQAAITANTIEAIVGKTINPKLNNSDRFLFNLEVKTIGSPAYFDNQRASGRCWIFATCNVLRTHVIDNYNLAADKFQFLQSYLFFYDKLEKANFFLDNIIDTVDEPLDSRLVSYLLRDPVSDGGQWDMIINLVNKYGLVPQEVFPDLANAQNLRGLNSFVVSKLREYAIILRELVSEKGKTSASVQQVKQAMMKQIYNIIAISLGTPPKPNDRFVWEFIDKDHKHKSFATTPLDFYANHVRFDALKHFSLLHDPRNEYNKLYTVDRLNNISGGKPIEYVNLEISELKKAAIKMLQKDEPVFFGSDVSKFGDMSKGVLDADAFDYELGFGTSLKLNKEERVRVGNSAMNHAMVITGVHLDANGSPVRWKIENSWGEDAGEHGYLLMTDKWFDDYVFQVVTNKSFVDRKVYEVWKAKKYNVLPYYDPMGSLA